MNGHGHGHDKIVVAETCWCGGEPRGWVEAELGLPLHRCLECCEEHCVAARMARRCQFALCIREAEVEVVVGAAVDPVRVCGLHVAPVLGWGVPEPLAAPVVRYIAA